MSKSIKELEAKAHQLRCDILDLNLNVGVSHVASSFSSVEILTSLYYGDILRYRTQEPKWDGRDRFILSKAHASILLYMVLGDLGFFPKENLKHYCDETGMFGAHLQKTVVGVETTGGSLGYGLGVGCGLAMSAKMNMESWFTFTLLGDGECYEGSVWEAMMFAGHNRLNNLVVIVDRNGMGASDFTENTVSLSGLEDAWRSFGWDVVSVDGHSIQELLSVLNRIRSRQSTKPLAIFAYTVKGRGVSFLENEPLAHVKTLTRDEAIRAREELEKNG